MGEQLLVLLIVGLAAGYSAWHLTPAAWRQQAVAAFARRCAGSRAARLSPALARAAAKPTGACAGCGARGQCPVGRSLR
ncbi:MAG: hypothetical protein JNL89_08055 [Rhodanobacteraceae bacterium]|nr:hypothetical protein [Rhodanobacteraceae bacterium]